MPRLVFIDTTDKHGSILAGSRNDDLIGTTLKVVTQKTNLVNYTQEIFRYHEKESVKECTYMSAAALSLSVKTPVDSTTYSAPAAAHGISSGFLYQDIVNQPVYFTWKSTAWPQK